MARDGCPVCREDEARVWETKMPTRDDQIDCTGCGALVPDGDGPTHRYLGASPGCWALIGEVWAREYSDVRYGSVHQLSVDAYAAQHPGTPSPQTIQSVTVHLVGLCAVFELGCKPYEATKAIQQAERHKHQFVWLDPPSSLGPITIVDVHGAQDPTEHVDRVERWARNVWQAWAPHHATVRRWTEQ